MFGAQNFLHISQHVLTFIVFFWIHFHIVSCTSCQTKTQRLKRWAKKNNLFKLKSLNLNENRDVFFLKILFMPFAYVSVIENALERLNGR